MITTSYTLFELDLLMNLKKNTPRCRVGGSFDLR
jgi:hypothetical protein